MLLAGLSALGEHAARARASCSCLEPLNRYEDHMVNRLEQAVELVETVGLPSVRVMADTYHMNIEEDEPTSALVKAAAPDSGTCRSATPTGSSRAPATSTGPR